MAQISMEAALEAARVRVGELAWENMLVRAQLGETELELAKRDTRIAELEQQAPPVPGPDTGDARPA